MEKSKMIMMVGIVASGKSTYAKELSKVYNANIHSSDALREELLNNINEQSANTDIFEELHRRIKVDLINGKSVVYDATNLSYKRRMTFLQSISKINCEKICIMMATPYEQCLEQNKMRDRVVPEHVIKNMYMNFNVPAYYEGWNDIQIIWNVDDNVEYDLSELFDRLDTIEQHNIHHKFTIGVHCRMALTHLCEWLMENDIKPDKNLLIATVLHDIGKEFSMEFKNKKGEDTEYAHFYEHHNVSAYDTLFYMRNRCDIKELLDICQLIQHHMQPFNMKDSDKAKLKFIKLVGQEFYDRLMILHMADKLAH